MLLYTVHEFYEKKTEKKKLLKEKEGEKDGNTKYTKEGYYLAAAQVARVVGCLGRVHGNLSG